jgi:hypothetical protein
MVISRSFERQLLGLVKHLDQRVGLILVALHRRLEDLEAIITARVLLRRSPGRLLCIFKRSHMRYPSALPRE